MTTIKALDTLGEKLFNITNNDTIFNVINKQLTSSGFYYSVSVTYYEDEIETTFSINEKNDVFDISTQYKGSLNVGYLSGINFDVYNALNTNFKQLVIDSKVTFEDIDKLQFIDDYTC